MTQIINNGVPTQVSMSDSLHNMAQANVAALSPRATAGTAVAATAAGATRPVTSFAEARARGQGNAAPAGGADAAAQAAERVPTKISRWFKEGTPFMHRTGGLPDPVTINVGTDAHPSEISYKNTEVASMINCLPRLQRAAAREALPQLLASRINNGESIARDVLNGTRTGVELNQASLQDVSDIMLFLDAKSRATGVGFSEGAFSIEDSEGRLYDFLNTSPEKYLRSSTHLSSQQNATITADPNAIAVATPNTHTNVHRGIDFPKGAAQGLPTDKRTVLFAVLPKVNGQARRIFLKPESHGCRISTLSNANRTAGRDGSGERSLNWKADLGQFCGHAKGAIASTARKIFNLEVAEARKERIPSAVKNAFRAFVQNAPDQAIRDILNINNPTDDAQGIRTMLTNIRDAIIGLPAGESRNNLASMAKGMTDALGSSLLDASHLTNRIGNEVLFDVTEIQAGIQNDNPIREAEIQDDNAMQLANQAKQTLIRDSLINPTEVQKEILSTIGSDLQLPIMFALPEIKTALAGIVNAARNDEARGGKSIHALYDSIGSMLQGLDKSVEDVKKITEKTMQLAVSTMDQGSLRDVYTLLSSPEAITQRSYMQLGIQSIADGLEGTPLYQLAGIVGRMPTYLPSVVGGIESYLEIPDTNRLPVQANFSQIIHDANTDIITPHPLMSIIGNAILNDAGEPVLDEAGNARLYDTVRPVLDEAGKLRIKDINNNRISTTFVADCIERGSEFTVVGVNNGERLTTEQSVMDAIPNLAMRAAVTRLACQTTNALFAQVLNATGLHSTRHGIMVASQPGLTRAYEFNPQTGDFTSTAKDSLNVLLLSNGQDPLNLRQDSEISYHFSCKLLQDDKGNVYIQKRKVEMVDGPEGDLIEGVVNSGTEAFMKTHWS